VFLKTGWNRYCLRRERARGDGLKSSQQLCTITQWLWEGKSLSNLAGRFFACECLIVGRKSRVSIGRIEVFFFFLRISLPFRWTKQIVLMTGNMHPVRLSGEEAEDPFRHDAEAPRPPE
jgi:hypothetical protein